MHTAMPKLEHPQFVLVGGGLAGGLLAVYLGRAGYDVDLYERRPDPAQGNFVGGRSINLAVSTRGLHALRLVSLEDDILAQAIPLRGRMIHGLDGGLRFQPYDRDPRCCIHSVGRAVLNSVTLDAARKLPNVRVHFNQRCLDVDFDAPSASLVHTESGETSHARGDLLIGVDGAFSAVRRAMQRLDRFDDSQRYLHHGYKELTIPPAGGGGFLMEKNALHIWPRRRFMMIALPNPDGSFTCTLFYPFDGPESFAALQTRDDVQRFFQSQFPDAVPLMPTLPEDFFSHPTGSMVTVRCRPWQHAGRVALLGDAAHAVVPFYGQGMNAAFEDVVMLNECISRYAPDWSAVFEAYELARKPHTDTIADLALANFIEMRDKTASRLFRGRKKLERTLHGLFPRWYTPLYSLVSFSRMPYADAVAKARRQDRAVLASAVTLIVLLVAVLLRGAGLTAEITAAIILAKCFGAGVVAWFWRWRALTTDATDSP
jgi:kynurenine 3-monooxygenase